MTNMDPVSAGGFASAAGHYARSRPAYARPAIGGIADAVGRGDVLDLGAGTGIFSGQLSRAGCRVTALEPLGEMLAQFRRSLPGLGVVRAVAEELPFASSSFDAVAAAQAFHWMQHDRVLHEAHRVLRRDGALVLAWNVRDESVGWVAQLTDLVERGSGGRPYSDDRERPWPELVAEHGGFRHVGTSRHENPVRSSPALVEERIRSTSFVAVMDEAAREELLAEVRALLGSAAPTRDRSTFDYPHHTVVHIWRRE